MRGFQAECMLLRCAALHPLSQLSPLAPSCPLKGPSTPHTPRPTPLLQDLEQAGSTKRMRGTLHLPTAGHGGGRLSQAVLLLQEELAGQAECGAGSEPIPEPAPAQLPGSGRLVFTGEASFDCPPEALLGAGAGAASLELKGFEGCAVEVPLSWGEASIQVGWLVGGWNGWEGAEVIADGQRWVQDGT